MIITRRLSSGSWPDELGNVEIFRNGPLRPINRRVRLARSEREETQNHDHAELDTVKFRRLLVNDIIPGFG